MILSSAVDIVGELIGFIVDILNQAGVPVSSKSVSYTHLRAHET